MKVVLILAFIITFFPVFLWKTFEESGYKPVKSLIPFYNYFIWLKIINKPLWWYIFLLMPFINVFMIFLMLVETVKCYKKYGLHEQALGVILPFVYIPYLGISDKEHYTHPSQLPKRKKSTVREWVDAIIFAVIAATIIRTFLIEAYTIPTSSMEKTLLIGDFLFVSKISYGPKVPNTPVAFPFTHHTLPLTENTKSYVEWIKLPYFRFPGLNDIKNNDVVVFNYPSGDTVVLQRQNEDYYQIVRDAERELASTMGNRYRPGMGRNAVWRTYDVTARPVDKRENYIKRCVAIHGDTLEIIDRQVYINGKAAENPPNMQYIYNVITDGTQLSGKSLEKLDISEGGMVAQNQYRFPLSSSKAAQLKQFVNVTDVSVETMPKGEAYYPIFPHDPENYPWNTDNFGPLVIPAKGMTVTLNKTNLPLYRKIIMVYEGNTLEEKGGKIFINGKEANEYTFRMDYYWMMGDNRHNSADSRFWGFVPQDHIVGKAVFVWLSLDKNKTLFKGKIRWNKMFRVIR